MIAAAVALRTSCSKVAEVEQRTAVAPADDVIGVSRDDLASRAADLA